MIDVLSNIFGFVEIEISGENVEAFLNLTHSKRIQIRNLRYTNRKITGRISPKDFKKLKHIKHQTKSKIKMLKKSGLCFRLNSLRGRTGLIIGFCLFLVILKGFSFFIQGIEVRSNIPINKTQVLSALNDVGIGEGTLKYKIDTNYTAQKLILALPDVKWASVNIEGAVLTVNLSIDKYKKEDNSPSNLIAKSDGIITKIDVVSGETIKSIGDSVTKGELLVSGKSFDAENCVIERSKGKIIANTEHIFSKTGYLDTKKYVDVKAVKRKVLKVLNFKIPLYLGSEKKPYKSKITEKEIKIMGKKMPFSFIEKTYYIKQKKNITVSKETLKELLKEQIESEINEQKFDSFVISEEKISEDKNSLTLTVKVSAVENIAVEVKYR